MAPLHRMLIPLWLTAMLVPLGGCLKAGTGPAKTADYLIVDLVDEFAVDEPSDSWQFSTPGAWNIRTDGQRRFLYVSPRPAAQSGEAAALESAIQGQYRFRNFSFSCHVRTDKGVGGKPCDACLVFGRQDDRNYFLLDLTDLANKPNVSLVLIDRGRATQLASATPPARNEFIRREWHQVGILRNRETGSIEAYVDDDGRPLVRVKSSAYEWGTIGIGSTTGGAAFGRVIISGEATTMP